MASHRVHSRASPLRRRGQVSCGISSRVWTPVFKSAWMAQASPNPSAGSKLRRTYQWKTMASRTLYRPTRRAKYIVGATKQRSAMLSHAQLPTLQCGAARNVFTYVSGSLRPDCRVETSTISSQSDTPASSEIIILYRSGNAARVRTVAGPTGRYSSSSFLTSTKCSQGSDSD